MVLCGHSQELERDKCWCSAFFLLFIHPESIARGIVPPTFRVGLPLQLNLSGNSLKYIQRYVSIVIPNPIKLIIKIEYHNTVVF